ncbi:MAG: DUF378 domain-containing protein [Clostridia bacterium]
MITILSILLVIVGAANWFSVGVFNFNFVDWIFQNAYLGARIVYGIVGVAGLWLIIYLIYNKFSPKRIRAIENSSKHYNSKLEDTANTDEN